LHAAIDPIASPAPAEDGLQTSQAASVIVRRDTDLCSFPHGHTSQLGATEQAWIHDPIVLSWCRRGRRHRPCLVGSDLALVSRWGSRARSPGHRL